MYNICPGWSIAACASYAQAGHFSMPLNNREQKEFLMNRDLVSYSIVFLGSLFFFALTFRLPVTEVTLINSAVFPRIVLGIMIMISAPGAYAAFRHGKAETRKKIDRAFLIGIAAILALVLAVQHIGFIPAAGSFITLFSLYMIGEVKPKTAIVSLVAGFGTAFGIHYVFTNILTFILP
jgi:hypothetical protein